MGKIGFILVLLSVLIAFTNALPHRGTLVFSPLSWILKSPSFSFSLTRSTSECEVRTECTSSNKLICQLKDETCREDLWSWCKTVNEDIKVWKNVMECDENGENCEEEFREVTEKQRVERCKIKRIPVSECPTTEKKFVCKRCKAIFEGEDCDAGPPSCVPCITNLGQNKNLKEFYSCMSNCFFDCGLVSAGENRDTCEACQSPDCPDYFSIQACFNIIQENLGTKVCPLPNEIPGGTPAPLDYGYCLTLCRDQSCETDTNVPVNDCEDVCLTNLMPYETCRACYHKGYTTKDLLPACLANDLAQITCQECLDDASFRNDPVGNRECLRRCQGDFFCDHLSNPTDRQNCQDTCYDNGCTDYDRALLCSGVIQLSPNYVYPCNTDLPEPLSEPLDDKACSVLCDDCGQYETCVSVCLNEFPWLPPHMCEWCVEQNENDIEQCLTTNEYAILAPRN